MQKEVRDTLELLAMRCNLKARNVHEFGVL